METDPEALVARRRKLFVVADQLHLSREERIDLASMILRRHVSTWKELSDGQVVRLLDAMEGYALISFWRTQA